ncbi:MAG TPA: hypothetical protein VGH97_01835 [Thermoanaerobaculia bacterium]|jgi:hypothetical protein
MNSQTLRLAALVLVLAPGAATAWDPPSGSSVPRADAAAGCGLGVNLPLVGRIVGAGNTLYISTLDVTNNGAAAQVDFYLDGTNQTSGATVSVTGSVSSTGELVPIGAGGSMRALSNAHFDDFIDALVQAGMLPASIETEGFLGSILFVFNGVNRSGQGTAFVRFYSEYGGGTIGQALRAHEITSNEPRSLMATFRDSRTLSSGPRLYANMFLSNIGLTPNGALAAGAVNVHVQAYANSTGQPVGTAFDVSIGPGQTASISDVLHRVAAPAGENTVIVVATATSGTAAIAGVAVEIDDTTKDGSVVDMTRGDF